MGSRSIDNHCNLTIILFCLLYLRTKNTFDFAAASGIKSSGLKSSLATGLSHSALRRLSLRNGPFRILRLLAHPHGPPPLPLPFFIPRQPIKQMNALTASAIRFINFSIFCFFLVTARCDHSRVNGTEKQKKNEPIYDEWFDFESFGLCCQINEHFVENIQLDCENRDHLKKSIKW